MTPEKAVELLYRFSAVSIDHASIDPAGKGNLELSRKLASQARELARKLFYGLTGEREIEWDDQEAICAAVPMPGSRPDESVRHCIRILDEIGSMALMTSDGDVVDEFTLDMQSKAGRAAALQQIAEWISAGHKISGDEAEKACREIGELYRQQ